MKLDNARIDLELTAYRLRLLSLSDRHLAGGRSLIAVEAQRCADALIKLLHEVPLDRRGDVDELISQFEVLRIKCLN